MLIFTENYRLQTQASISSKGVLRLKRKGANFPHLQPVAELRRN